MKGSRRGFALALLVGALLASGTHGFRVDPGVVAQEARRAAVEKTVTARKYAFDPPRIEVQQDDILKITFQTEDIPHSFTIDEYKIAKRATPGHPAMFEFRCDRAGTFTYYCNITTDEGCKQMKGQLIVRERK